MLEFLTIADIEAEARDLAPVDLPKLPVDAPAVPKARPSNHLSKGWTDERVATLRKLNAEGFSCSQIAAEIGGITRNAVIGKLHRLGLTQKQIVTPEQKRQRDIHAAARRHEADRRRALARGLQLKPRSALPIDPATLPAPQDDTEIPVAQRCTVLDLTSENCHWPVGDPREADFFFCGGPALSGRPYCAYHSRVGYQPAPGRHRSCAEEWATNRAECDRIEAAKREAA